MTWWTQIHAWLLVTLGFRRNMLPIEVTGKVLFNDWGREISTLVGRDESYEDVIFVAVKDMQYPASTSGSTVTLNQTYFTIHQNDLGAIIHEIAHAIQKAPNYTGDFVWLIEGLADFVRYETFEDIHLEKGDPRKSYRYAASFWLWIHNLGDFHYNTLVDNINNGIQPQFLEHLLAQYSKTYSG